MDNSHVNKAEDSPKQSDPSFGVDGFLKLQEEDCYARTLTTAAGERWIVGIKPDHNFELIRVTSDGKVDTTFKVIGSFDTALANNSFFHSVVEDAQSRLLVLGHLYESSTGIYYPAAARYTCEGQLDKTFGEGGRVVFKEIDAPQPKGEPAHSPTVFHFYRSNRVTSNVSYLVSVNDNGTLNTDFNARGFLELMYRSQPIEVTASQSLPDGSCLFTANTPTQVLVGRVTAKGQVDTTFADYGFHVLELPGSRHNALVTDRHSAIWALGKVQSASGNKLVVLKLSSRGIAAPDFNGGEQLELALGNLDPFGNALSIDSKARVLITGCHLDKNTRYPLVVRLLPEGKLDPAFCAGQGYVAEGNAGEYNAVALRTDDRIVAAGHWGIFPYYVLVAGYLG
ncbi:putative delta-60 repeat protein [Pseudomonas sp. GGS8]|uniref:hypothetical protein n=1 Tax=Pseudomonas sp. GGS8 TaxID=2817892 RepID=UPI00209D9506|nr:hypothetical protein [Pseudomonas sp. GGS8]MCP1441292.1 putative delta-60 repeat protein [Pseudomonas sp. GGS8]